LSLDSGLEVRDELLVSADTGRVCDLAAGTRDTRDQGASCARRNLGDDTGVDLGVGYCDEAGEKEV